MSAPHIKPCPFCGEHPHVCANQDTIIIECKTVNCPACPITTGDLLIDAFKAAAAWNRRADLPPKVRELEWVELSPKHMMAALPLFGNIRVESWGGPFQVVWSVPGSCNTFTEGKWPTAEAAKAAAQADYEARILAALVQP